MKYFIVGLFVLFLILVIINYTQSNNDKNDTSSNR
jgi:hypothetical protein